MPSPARSPNPTILYDNERSSTSPDTLDPPDIDSLLRRKRKWYRAIHALELPRAAQTPLTCLSIGLSALQANGVYVWPTYGPVVAKRLELNATEAQTIVVGGILGVYLMAAPLGSLTDRYGPRVGSLVSAFLSGTGYLSFSAILSKHTPGTPLSHICLTAAYFCVGAATVGSYFASLTCASLSFPTHPTLSLSVPLSLIGLSSLILSSFSTLSPFLTPSHDLDPSKFLFFLGLLSSAINLFSALFMRVLPQPIELPPTPASQEHVPEEDEVPSSPMSQLLHLDEHTPLLIGGPEVAREEAEAMERGKEAKWTAWKLVKNWEGFWAFGILLALCIGPGEMVIASIGSILISLLPPTIRSVPLSFASLNPLHPLSTLSLTSPSTSSRISNSLALRNKHVSILSITSTLARLLVGILADYLAPPLTALPAPHSDDPNAPTHIFVQKNKVRLRRSTFASLCALALGGVLAWSAGWLQSEESLWVLSSGTGLMYGAIFTLTPAIVSTHFGPTNFGLAWGMVSYFAALGAVLFSYLYALISTAVAEQATSVPNASPHTGDTVLWAMKTDEPPACYGTECFRPTLWVGAVCCIVSAMGLVLLGRRWKL